MKSGQRRSPLSYIPGYANNSVLQLIIVSAVAYVMLGFSWAVIKIMYAGGEDKFYSIFLNNLAIQPLQSFKSHWWTILTYGWFQAPNSFMELLSNMLWLYLFGNVVQMLVGRKQIIPLFFYSLIAGGLFYTLAQVLPGAAGVTPVKYLLGAKAGMVGMAVAAITISPNYRFYFTETFSVPIMLIFGIFAILMLMSTGFLLPALIMLTGGGLCGFAYIRLLRSGYKPGGWIYDIFGKAEALVTPKEPVMKHKTQYFNLSDLSAATRQKASPYVTQKRIDDILDKINQKGYKALTQEEKDILARAGKEDK